jgi:ankyrin repeat protein
LLFKFNLHRYNALDVNGNSALHYAAAAGRHDAMAVLVAGRCTLNQVDP